MGRSVAETVAGTPCLFSSSIVMDVDTQWQWVSFHFIASSESEAGPGGLCSGQQDMNGGECVQILAHDIKGKAALLPTFLQGVGATP